MIRFFIATCVCLISIVGQAGAQSVVIRPDRLREGDEKTRNVTLEASVAPGASLSVAVSYRSDPAAAGSSFIPKFSVQDNTSEDRDPQDGKIRLVLPRAFDRTGVYLIEIDDRREVLSLVHEPNNTSYFRQFADWLVKAAGGGERGLDPVSALERIEELTRNKGQDNVAVWIAPMPAAGQEIEPKSLKLNIRSALMPSWSRYQNHLACSAWQNGKWRIAAYAINQARVANQLWQWNSPGPGGSDFSPAWSPNGDGVVFVRLDNEQKSDIWILELDRKRRPTKEIRVTTIGNVQAILGWDKDVGIVFETKSPIDGHSSIRQVWALKPAVPTTQVTPLSDGYSVIRGGAPKRGTLIYTVEKNSPPFSLLYEMNSSGSSRLLLVGETCTHRWPTVSSDERWLAFDSDCPH